jgi:hypothetical protein
MSVHEPSRTIPPRGISNSIKNCGSKGRGTRLDAAIGGNNKTRATDSCHKLRRSRERHDILGQADLAGANAFAQHAGAACFA